MAQVQEDLKNIKVEGSSGGGMVKVMVNGKKDSLFPKIRKDFLKYFKYFNEAKYSKSFFVIRSTKRNKNDERTTDIEIDKKFISVHSGKWINCIEAAKTVSKMI